MDVEVKIQGLQELDARLQDLGALAGQKLVTRILRKVAKPMQDQARSNATAIQRSGALARSVGIVRRKPKGAQVAKVSVTSRAKDRTSVYLHNTAYGRERKGIFYGWMVDQGHKTATGAVRARPWWSPSVNATEGRAVNSFIAELRKAVERAEKRKGKTPAPDSLVTE